jgi:hypothetical protein
MKIKIVVDGYLDWSLENNTNYDKKKFEYAFRLLQKLENVRDNHEKSKKEFSLAVKRKNFLKAAKQYKKIMKIGIKRNKLESELFGIYYPILMPTKVIAEQIKKDIKKIKKLGYKPVIY